MNSTPMNPTDDELPDDTLRRAMAALDDSPVPEGPSAALMAATLDALAAGASQSMEISTRTFSPTFFHGSKRMQRMATAAGVLLAISLVVALPVAFQSRASAFSEALRQMRGARMMSLVQESRRAEGPMYFTTKQFYAQDGRLRIESGEMENGSVLISDVAGNLRLMLNRGAKTAHIRTPRRMYGVLPLSRISWLERLQKQADKPDKVLGTRTLDGREVSGFEVTQDWLTYTIWIDVATKKPVLIEYDTTVLDSPTHITLRDFHFDQELDETLFSIEVPAGYQVQPEMPAANKEEAEVNREKAEAQIAEELGKMSRGEQCLHNALQLYTQRADGKFPESIKDSLPWTTLFAADMQEAKNRYRTLQMIADLEGIAKFLSQIPTDDYAYLGAGKNTEDKAAVIFWHKKPSGKYRAMFGDLSFKTIQPDQLLKEVPQPAAP